MIIPGANLLIVALSVIGGQTVGHQAWTGRTANAIGVLVDTYAARVDVVGSFQPLDPKLSKQYGLDFAKSYATFYASSDITSVEDDRGSDLFFFNGRKWTAPDGVNWRAQDGWKGLLLVDIGPDA